MQGTHVTLLREPQTNLAKVFLLGESGAGQKLRVWRFVPTWNAARLPNVASTDSNSLIYPVPHPNNRKVDLFCGGHSTLADGRMLYIGGMWAPSRPCQEAYAFDPRWYPDTTHYAPWDSLASMAVERWYPTATALADGRVLAAAGTSRTFMLTFGGDSATGNESHVLHPLVMAGQLNWSDTTATPDAGGVTNGKWPEGREDHGFSGDRAGRVFLFGGRKGIPGNFTYFNDVWTVFGSGDNIVRDDSTHRWSKCEVASVDGLVPRSRARFAITWAGLDKSTPGNRTLLHQHSPYATDSIVVYIHGGIDNTGAALGDLWRGWRSTASGYYQWVWQKLRDDPATARYGHTMVYDPGPVKNLAYPDYARLLMFGGRTSESAMADASVLACQIGSWDRIQAGWWQPPVNVGTYGAPPARDGHVAVMQTGRLGGGRRMYVFGGQQNDGTPVDSVLWYLARNDAGLPDTTYSWARTPRVGGPSPRTRSTAVWFEDQSSLVLFGGDTNGSASGGYTNELWSVALHPALPEYGEWTQPYLRDLGLPNAPALAGSAGWGGYGDGITTRHLEAFNPSGSSSAGGPCSITTHGTWTTITTQDSLSARPMTNYPFLFLLPDGRLFSAGLAPYERPDLPYKRFFDLQTKQWADSTSQAHYDAQLFGSAVMYRPGKVLRAGGHGDGDNGNGSSRTETISISAGTLPGWQKYDDIPNPPLLARENHNLTLLPTGDILATGGRAVGEDSSTCQRNPQIWDVTAASWNNPNNADSLVADPNPRNYHSAAILLPDARVLTSGGEGKLNDKRFTTSVYEPPYLFRSDDSYASRPALQDGPETLPYGSTFTYTVPDSTLLSQITSMAVIRPGSVTHSFDQNQRYVPLGFVARSNPARLLVQAPANANTAPPGEYMLFVVANLGTDAPHVPSLAKWTIVKTQSGGRDSLDVIAPRGGSYLALTDLSTCPNLSADLTLGWTAPADDDTIAFSGLATAYNLRYKLNSSSEPNFNAWTAIPTEAPGQLGAAEEVVVSGLSSGHWYRFQLKAVGDNADTSSLSNALVAKPKYCEDDGGGGGGGGGGGLVARLAGVASLKSGASGGQENTVFPGPLESQPGRDGLRLEATLRLVESRRSVYVRQGTKRGLSLDRARLVAVDHDLALETAMTADERFVAGVRTPALAVLDRGGRDVLAAASSMAAEPVYADSGEILSVTLPPAADSSERFLLVDASAGGGGNGVRVESVGATGTLTPLGSIQPRRRWSRSVLALAGGSELRLSFDGAYAVRFVGALGETRAARATDASLLAATGAEASDLLGRVSALDGQAGLLAPTDTLSLEFADVPPTETARDWYLVLDGVPLAADVAAFRAGQVRDDTRREPLAFRLFQNVPNPFAHSTLIRFELPSAGEARLEIYDTQGRLMRRFATRYEAGRHEIAWDLRDGHGRIVPPGIYVYRLAAAAHAATRRMVVIP